MTDHDDSTKPSPSGTDQTLTELGSGTVEGPTEHIPGTWEDASKRYEVETEHARGGLGRVMLGRDRKLDRTVAVKELLNATPRAVARFDREVRITARLEHPGIVPVHDMGLWPDGTRFYTMKLVAGEPLRDVIKECATLAERLALIPHIIAVADAMAYAHSEGVIHRDLKPSNVIVGAFGETIIVDWGLAKDLHDPVAADDFGAPYRSSGAPDLTLGGEVLGTPAYMAPEQARGEDVDERADVYSLGAMLYDVLAGRSPYRGTTPDSIVAEVLRQPPPPVAQGLDLRADLVAVVETAMARDPADRYADAGELREDLQRYQAGQLVRAHRYSVLQRAARRVRRALAPIALVAALGTVGATVLYNVLAGSPETGRICAAAGSPVDDIWTESDRDAIRGAFSSVGGAAAAERFAAVTAGLDTRADGLRDLLASTCRARATAPPGGAVHDVLDAREQCSSRRADELAATIALLSRSDAEVFANAEEAVGSLLGADSCTDDEALLSAQPLPDDPAQRPVARAVYEQLAKSSALSAAGKYPESVALAQDALAASERLGFAPLTAFSYQRLIASQDASGEFNQVVALARPAIEAASLAGNDDLIAQLFGDHIHALDTRLERTEEADGLLWQYELAVSRVRSKRVRGDSMLTLGNIARNRKRYDDALRYYERSKQIRIDAWGPTSPKVAAVVGNIGQIYTLRGKYEQALAEHEAALAMRVEHYGQEHPEIAMSYNSIGTVYGQLGRHDEEIAYYERAVKLNERVLPPDHLELGISMFNLGNLLVRNEYYERALAYQRRALAIFETKLSPDHMHVTYPLTSIGECLTFLGRPAEAIEPLERALRLRAARASLALNLMGDTQFALAKALWDAGGDRKRARTLARAAVGNYRTSSPQSKLIDEAIAIVDAWIAKHR